jgi:hypothetical protein
LLWAWQAYTYLTLFNLGSLTKIIIFKILNNCKNATYSCHYLSLNENINIIVILISSNIYGQSDTVLNVNILKIEENNTFDSLCVPARNLIELKTLWVDKSDTNQYDIQLHKDYEVVANQVGPQKAIWDGDTIHFRGHSKIDIYYIDADKIKFGDEKQLESEFDPANAVMILNYYK